MRYRRAKVVSLEQFRLLQLERRIEPLIERLTDMAQQDQQANRDGVRMDAWALAEAAVRLLDDRGLSRAELLLLMGRIYDAQYAEPHTGLRGV